MTEAEITAYADYLRGLRIHSQPRKAPGPYKERTSVGIVPFAFSPGADGNFVRVTVTRGALGILGALNIANLDGIFGLNLAGTGTGDAVEGFYPAVARITLVPEGTLPLTAGVSAFTGRPRNYKPGRSGTVPFGRGTTTGQPDAKNPASVQTTIADLDYKDALNAIRSAVSGATYTGSKRVSFEPELFRATRPSPTFGALPVAPDFP